MPEFNGNRLANIGDPIYDKDGVNLRTLSKKISSNNYLFLPISGGTVTGAAYFSGGLSATTISATTIYSGGTDLFDIILERNNILSTSAITSSTGYINPKIDYYGVNYNGNVNVSIPSAVGKDGLNFSIKDEGGYAGTYRIRVTPDSGYIDGNNYVDMKINYMSLHLVARGGNWWII